MEAREIRILGVHGLGHQKQDWFEEWKAAIRGIYPDPTKIELKFDTCFYDPIFETVHISPAETAAAVVKLGWSGLSHVFRRDRGFLDQIAEIAHWTAGYVVAWAEDRGFQEKTRKLFLDKVADFKPDIILAHSLGSLVTYNAISHPDAHAPTVAEVLRKAHYVTLGSQIANAFVLDSLSFGRVEPLPVGMWWHLFNPYDRVFTERISIPGAMNFRQVITAFDDDGPLNHSPAHYIGNDFAIALFWRPYEEARPGARSIEFTAPATRKPFRARKERMRRRALLVGINDYVDPASRLEGCVNDVFLMSAALQDCGFEPDEIRTCLDRRATASGILERMAWLVEDFQPGDDRVFYYSGHGAQLPAYGPYEEPDRLVETLVPCDFDWSPETAITDDHIYRLYSQLPYDARFAMIFDCCHAGGMHRQGGSRARGITPPDDIRHRQLKWDRETQMWVERQFERINPGFSRSAKAREEFFGKSGSKVRLGRASSLRRTTLEGQYNEAKELRGGPVGPYLPLILEACGEDQLSFEYRDGAASYGAFTYCLTSLLRQNKGGSFNELIKAVGDRLADLQYGQKPAIQGPSRIREGIIPWRTVSSGEVRVNGP